MELTHKNQSPVMDKQPKWLTILRIALGIVILLKGISFFKDSTDIQIIVQSPGLSILDNNVSLIAFIITYCNLLGGFFITVGLFTRWVALALIPILIGAIIFGNNETGMSFNNFDLALTVAVLLLLSFFVMKGSGTISADEFFRTYTNAGEKSGFTKKFFE